MRSAAVYGDEDEEGGKIQKWLAEKFKVSAMDLISTVSVVLGFILALGIFIFLPRVLVDLIPGLGTGHWAYYVLLGVFKLAIFLAYLGLILLLKDIRRLYQYHGANIRPSTLMNTAWSLPPKTYSKAHACTTGAERRSCLSF